MAKAGVHGFVSAGSTAEAVALSSEEKVELIKATRQVLAENGFDHLQFVPFPFCSSPFDPGS